MKEDHEEGSFLGQGVPEGRQGRFRVLTSESEEENVPNARIDSRESVTEPRRAHPRTRRRLVSVSQGRLQGEGGEMSVTGSQDEVGAPDAHSARLQGVRERLRGSQSDRDRSVRSAIEVITSLAARVGQDDQEFHPAIHRQQ